MCETIFFRKTAINHEQVRELLSLKEDRLESELIKLYSKTEIKEKIRNSSPAFSTALDKRILKSEKLDELFYPLYNYILRLGQRTTPFGLMAEVGFYNIRGTQKNKENWIGFYEEKISTEYLLKNPTMFSLGEKCFFYKWEDKGNVRIYSIESFKRTSELDKILYVLNKPIPRNAVSRFLQVKNLDETITKLLNLKIIISSNEPVNILNQPMKKLENENEINDKNEIYNFSFEHEESLTSKDLNKIRKTAQTLFNIFGGEIYKRSHHHLLLDFKKQFISKYEDREVALIELLNTASGIEFKMIKDISKKFEHQEYSDFLIKKIFTSKIKNSGEWILTNEDIVKISSILKSSKPKKVHKDRTSLTAKIEKIGDQSLWMKSSPCGLPHVANLRFLDTESISLINPSIDEKCSDVLYADIEYVANQRTSSYTKHPNILDNYISITGFHPHLKTNNLINLNDLNILIQNDRVLLRSKSRDMYVQPVCLHNQNFLNDLMPIARFLNAVAKQDHPDFLYWMWPSDLNIKEFPRIVLNDVVVSPRKWRFYKEELLFEIEKGQSFLPNYVDITFDDTFITINTDNKENFYNYVKQLDTSLVEISENYSLKKNTQFCYEHNCVVPIDLSKHTNKVMLRESSRKLNQKFNILNDYLCMKIDIHPESGIEVLNILKNELEFDFYIFYIENGLYQIRIRSLQEKVTHTKIRKLNSTILKLQESHLIRDYRYDDYYSDDMLNGVSSSKYLTEMYEHNTKYLLSHSFNTEVDLYLAQKVYFSKLKKYLKIEENLKLDHLEKGDYKKIKELKTIDIIESRKNIDFSIIVDNDQKIFLYKRLVHMGALRISAFHFRAYEQMLLN